MDLVECGYCEGVGFIEVTRDMLYAPGTYGDIFKHSEMGMPNLREVTEDCPICKGNRKVKAPYSADEGGAVRCEMCGGNGRVPNRRCRACSGTGWVGGVPA